MVVKAAEENQSLHWLSETSLALPGVVTVKTVPTLLRQFEKQPGKVEMVDCTAVHQADSSALALLLSWQSQLDQPLKIKGLPEQLQTLLHLYDLESVLVI
ncbi:STAS domain-containing protein [Thiomicrorhabdus sp. zzn3]|uniref:STAS domain-containing protein n=1 Tax=Thiomicrorhabdus sp. zzn3 TaxID=3039775 RepID=UPI0024365824|nr:STAS domain-containing protein [Thiomicrorhabdus sp. zzn3]MDG6777427.1 STAS domain-containing protein [Thiomicrorhabdus sp. zzn3]